jgi:formylglycine-generating enzyme required for sulfatase activity
MGDPAGHPDERPLSVVTIDRPFWMGRCEVTNRQFARFDPRHESGVEPMHGYQFGIHGYPAGGPDQPVVRVSWEQAMAFCDWLSAKTGRRFTLPTEAQWEYACRAGAATPMWYGDLDTDFSSFANLGDAKLREFALDTYIRVHLVPNPNKYDDWVPKDDRFNDGGFVSAPVGSYQPNPWGLYDVHGNVWEWTRSAMRPYLYRPDDGRNDPAAPAKRVVRGGSWYDRPERCRSAFRLAYQPYQCAFNVGFRVVMEEE